MWRIACSQLILVILLFPVSTPYPQVNLKETSIQKVPSNPLKVHEGETSIQRVPSNPLKAHQGDTSIQRVPLESQLPSCSSTPPKTPFGNFPSKCVIYSDSTTLENSRTNPDAKTDSYWEATTSHVHSQTSQVPVAAAKPRGKYADLYPIEDWKKNGWLTDDYERFINVFWMDFPPPSNDAHYAFAAVYFILTLIGLSGNVLVFTMIVSFRQLRTPSNCLVANLAVADFFMMSRGPIFIYNCFHFGPVTGYWGCQIYGVVGGMTGIGAIMSLAAIAKDRYSAIVHPFDPAYKMSKRKAVVTITFIWIYAGFFSTLPFTCERLGVKPYLPEGFMTSCSFDYVSEESSNRIFILCLFLGAWFVPFTIISSSYYRIARHFSTVSITRLGQERQQRRGELRLTAVVLLVIAVWFLSWTPYATVALIGISGNRHLLTPFSSMVPAVFCKTAASIDPFLYALSHPRFRAFLFKIWCPRKYQERRLDGTVNYAAWRSDCSVRFLRKESVGTTESPVEITHM